MASAVDFYQDVNGNAPVEKFLDDSSEKERAKLLGLIAKLKDAQLCFWPTLGTRIKLSCSCTVLSRTRKTTESDIRIPEGRMEDHNRRLKTHKRVGVKAGDKK